MRKMNLNRRLQSSARKRFSGLKSTVHIVIPAILLGLGMLSADVPHLLSYQGRLTDGGGAPIVGSHNITFRLYTVPTGGSAIWTETQSLTLNSEGLYNAMLGEITPFPVIVTFEQQYWLGVAVDGGAEICRYQLGASPYALNIADTIRKTASQVFEGSTSDAIQIFSPGYAGIYIEEASGNGIDVYDATGTGFLAFHPGGHGFFADTPGGVGFEAFESVSHGFFAMNPDSAGMLIRYPGTNGIEIDGSAVTGAGIRIEDPIGTGDPDTGIVIRNVQDVGIFIDSTNSSSGNGVQIYYPGNYGLQIYSPGDDAVNIYSPDGNGVYIYSPYENGVDVWFPGDNCFECNGSPVTLFRVSNTCEVFSHSYNQYIVDENGVGYIAPMSATTERWLEHIGESQLVDGECRIELPKEFLEGTTIDENHPMQVFLTPYGHLGDYTVERYKTYFIVHQIEGDPNAQFAYKIHAKIKGYENNTSVPIDLNDYIDEENNERE